MHTTSPTKHRILQWNVLMVAFALLLIVAALAPAIAGPDIDVVYISRTPRYQKYKIEEEFGLDANDKNLAKLHLTKDQEGLQRWPKKGELITFTAVIKNPGDAPTGSFAYKWFFDGKEVKSGTLDSIKPGEQTTITYQWKWDSEWNDHTVKFVADPNNAVKENVEVNNSREDRTNALSFRLHVWQSVYDWFHTEGPKLNPQISGFEDWAQYQLGNINQMFKEAVYPTSPNGILERVRLDDVVIEPNDTKEEEGSGCHAPADLEWDCRWGFTPNEYPQIFIDLPFFIKEPYTWIMHEWGHQMGKIDVYQLYIEKEWNHVQPYGHNVIYNNDLMTATLVTEYSEMNASVFNYDLHARRGHFGEYLYDIPQTCKIRILDAYGKPLPNAKIKFYQDHNHEVNSPEDFIGTTDSNGCFTLPNRSVHGEEFTGTGHTMRDNPWGLLHPAGFNSLFFCDIKADGQTDYQYIEVTPFNMAFRAGHKDTYTYDVQTTIAPSSRVTANNLYGIKMISAKKGYAVGAAGTILQWDGKTWSQITSPTGLILRAIDADVSTGFTCAVGASGTVVVCINGTWTKKNIDDKPYLTACAVPSAKTIIVGGQDGALYRSTDQGETWTKIEATDKTIKSIHFGSPNVGVMVCDGSVAYYTKDGGATWIKSNSDFIYKAFAGWGKTNDITGNLTDCSMASETEAWACCEQGALFRSMDSGVTWSPYTTFANYGKWDPLYCIDMRAGGNGWCSGGLNKIYDNVTIRRFSNNKWWDEPTFTWGASDAVYDISSVAVGDGWIVGKGGLILHIQDQTWTAVSPNAAAK